MIANDTTLSVQDHIRRESRKNFVINLFLNASIAYGTKHGLTELNAWGEHGYGIDLIITGFLLSTILGGVFITIYRRKHSKKEIVPTGGKGQALAWLLPFNPWLAAPWIGVLGTALAVPSLLIVLALFDVSTLSPAAYALIKGLWAAILAAIIVPIAILQGLRTTPQ